jgi:hypothetical protein
MRENSTCDDNCQICKDAVNNQNGNDDVLWQLTAEQAANAKLNSGSATFPIAITPTDPSN